MKWVLSLRENITRALLLLLVAASFSFVPMVSSAASALDNNCTASGTGGQSQICPGNLPKAATDTHEINTIKNIVFSIIGGLALLIITVSGMRYITSAGDPQKAANARNGIIFALIGLVVALAADAIVSYVVRSI